MPPLPHKIAALVFIQTPDGRHLLLHRAKQPNLGAWSPIGGKLETSIGESPHQCAIRETLEETGHAVTASDLHLFAIIAEKSYEQSGHWLLFLFNCTKPIQQLPPDIPEGSFALFTRDEITQLPIPDTDRQALWPLYDQYRHRFIALSLDCQKNQNLLTTEQLN